ncbi:hypothetical protein [Halococcus sp. PRR34]|uniref:hypothetical protein n=1 Tax=Halococcus sp. PRR34 TaxID=3020830 RepID=UPI002362335F|nr:hypothetical protein [Halococcus sp. PRR34]
MAYYPRWPVRGIFTKSGVVRPSLDARQASGRKKEWVQLTVQLPFYRSGAGTSGPSKGVLAAVVDGTFLLLVVILGSLVAMVAAIVGTLAGLAGVVSGN